MENPQSLAEQQVMQPNPFAAFQDSQFLPPIPLQSNQGLMIGELLNDDNVPDEIKQQFYYVFSRDNSLTFLDEIRKQSKMLSFDIIKIDQMNSKPYYDWTFEDELNQSIMRNAFETKLDRSQGIKGEIKNERTTQQSQFTENRNFAQSQAGVTEQRDTFLKRLLGRR